jgi:hypothetical protein
MSQYGEQTTVPVGTDPPAAPASPCARDFEITVQGRADLGQKPKDDDCADTAEAQGSAQKEAEARLEAAMKETCDGRCPADTGTCRGVVSDVRISFATTVRRVRGEEHCFVVCTMVARGKCSCSKEAA